MLTKSEYKLSKSCLKKLVDHKQMEVSVSSTRKNISLSTIRDNAWVSFQSELISMNLTKARIIC